MKLIIEIEDFDYRVIKENKGKFNKPIYDAIANGIPLKELSNIRVLETIFPQWSMSKFNEEE